MRNYMGLMVLLAFFSCKEPAKEKQDSTSEDQNEASVEMSKYPEELQKVFDAHGGLDYWKSQKTLVYEMPKSDYSEVHTTHLHSRRDRINSPNYSMGFDGKNVWLSDENGSYKGDPVFYHNLMFYFYAMPFIVADNGINYGTTEDLVFEGKSYPGIRISYDSEVGASPKDEYYVHYDPETYQMTWLGYTVTYRSGEKSDNVKWVRYNDWMSVDALVLPKSITWHNYEGRDIREANSTTSFEKVSLSETAKPDSFFAMPEEGKVIVGKTL